MENKEMNNELDLELIKIDDELDKIPSSLTKYIDINLETILSIIKKYPRNKKVKLNLSSLSDEIELSDTAYKTLSTHIQKKFPEYIINASTLSSIITRVKRRKGLTKQRESKKIVQQPVLITQGEDKKQVAGSQLLHDKSFVIVKNERPQKQEEDKSSSVVVEKIDLENESQPVVRVGDLSTGLVSQAQYKDLINFFEKFESFGEVREPLTKLVQVNRSEHYKKQWTQEDEEMAKNYVEVIKLANINLKEWQNIKNFKFDDLDIERFKTKWGTFKKDFEKSVFIDYMKKYFEFHQVN